MKPVNAMTWDALQEELGRTLPWGSGAERARLINDELLRRQAAKFGPDHEPDPHALIPQQESPAAFTRRMLRKL